MSHQPLPGIRRVLLEPRPGRSQAEGVAPGVHVAAQALPTDPREVIGEEDLQVADGALFQILPSGVGVQLGAAFGTHDDGVAPLVEGGVHRGVAAHEEGGTAQARLRFAPVATGDGGALGHRHNRHAEAVEEFLQSSRRQMAAQGLPGEGGLGILGCNAHDVGA